MDNLRVVGPIVHVDILPKIIYNLDRRGRVCASAGSVKKELR